MCDAMSTFDAMYELCYVKLDGTCFLLISLIHSFIHFFSVIVFLNGINEYQKSLEIRYLLEK